MGCEHVTFSARQGSLACDGNGCTFGAQGAPLMQPPPAPAPPRPQGPAFGSAEWVEQVGQGIAAGIRAALSPPAPPPQRPPAPDPSGPVGPVEVGRSAGAAMFDTLGEDDEHRAAWVAARQQRLAKAAEAADAEVIASWKRARAHGSRSSLADYFAARELGDDYLGLSEAQLAALRRRRTP